MGLKGGRDWLLRITIKAKNDNFDKSGFYCCSLGSYIGEDYGLKHGLWKNIVHQSHCVYVQVVQCTTLRASFTLYDSRHRVLFQKTAGKFHIPYYCCISTAGVVCWGRNAFFYFAHRPQVTLQRNLIAFKQMLEENVPFIYVSFDVK